MMTRLCQLLALLCCTAAASADSAQQWSFAMRREKHVRRLASSFRRTLRGAPPYVIRNATQFVDHFNDLDNRTFTARYLLNDTQWTKGGPIFVMTGAEGGNVEDTFWAYGSYFDMFLELGGCVVFAEMRYFGESIPFGSVKEALKPTADRIGHLSLSQVTEDYYDLVYGLVGSMDAWDSPVYTFGGSLSGTIATLMRLKYPQLISGGAVVSSAPIQGFVGIEGMNQYAWHKRVTDTWSLFSPGCPDVVRRGFVGVQSATEQRVADYFNACEKNDAKKLAKLNPIADVTSLAWSIFEGQAEFAYPPAYSTISDDCASMRRGASPIDIFKQLLQLPGPPACLNLTLIEEDNSLPSTVAWVYLSCTQVIHPIGSNNVTDMFPPGPWTVSALAEGCRASFPFVRTEPEYLPKKYGLYHTEHLPRYTSNILWTYGTLDPWATMGLSKSLSKDLQVLWVPNGTHCSDAEASNPAVDTTAMVDARKRQTVILMDWVDQFRAARHSSEDEP